MLWVCRAIVVLCCADRFALDWLQTENVLTVLFGNEASIVVRLHINPAYPTSGDVSLLSAVGLPEGTTISQLQVCHRDYCKKLIHS